MEKPRSLRDFLKQFCKHLIFGVQTALTINVKKNVSTISFWNVRNKEKEKRFAFYIF